MAENIKNITVIVPVHMVNDEVKELLNKALDSVPSEYPIMIACPSSVVNDMQSLKRQLKVVDCGKETNFCSLVNMAVKVVDTTWFSILEFDDTYTSIYFKVMEEYIQYMPEVSVLGVLEDLVDYNKKTFIGYGNEATWASSFSNEMGYIDNDCLQDFFDFYLTGSLFNTKDWNTQGGLKPSIKITFWYEFLLRLTNNNKKVFIVPKIGYTHYVDRNGSLFNEYRSSVDEKETQWWFDLAKQECFYKNDRNKTYKLVSQD